MNTSDKIKISLSHAVFVVTLLQLLIFAGCSEPKFEFTWNTDDEVMRATGLMVDELRCEYRVDPLGVDEDHPRLFWVVKSDRRGTRQVAYQVQVADTQEALESGRANLWDSGRVNSGDSIQVIYAGRALMPSQRCWWRVKVWSDNDESSAWSRSAVWEMGLMHEKAWSARWINDGVDLPGRDEDFYKPDRAPRFRKKFKLSGPMRQARLYITGLGYYQVHINGLTVGRQRLDPLWTDYRDHVYYSVFDVSGLMQPGDNTIGVELGNGWYNPLPLRMWGRLNLREHLPVGRPCLRAQLEVIGADGSRQVIATDETWRVAPGPIVRNSIYLGEHYDARAEHPGWSTTPFDDSKWSHSAIVASPPTGRLIATPVQPITPQQSIRPVSCKQTQPGHYIFDFGRNFTGTVKLRVHGHAGQQIQLRYGELLHDDGTLNVMTSVCGQIKRNGEGGPGAPDVAEQSDIYILRGDKVETYEPRFTFHSFRYVEIIGWPGEPTVDDLAGIPLRCDVTPIGQFKCSNELFNDIEQMVRNTFESNLMGVQSDCPHRERFGYGGDIVATADTFMLHYDMAAFYSKAVHDYSDAAQPGGGLTETAPYVGVADGGFGGGSGPVGWGLAHPLLIQKMLRYYGDRRLLEQHYMVARQWVDMVHHNTPSGIVNNGIGDHEAIDKVPVHLTGTAFYFAASRLVSELADRLGHGEESRKYAALAETVRQRFVEIFTTETPGRLTVDKQGAYAIALAYGLVPEQREAMLERLAELIASNNNCLTTGIFATPAMLEELSRGGRMRIAAQLVDHRNWPGWGYMLDHGATTLWEHWKFSDNVYSHNHPMFGSVSAWMIQHVAGLEITPDAVGCDHVTIRPQPTADIAWAEVKYESIRGTVISRWRRNDNNFTLQVRIPVGAEATVMIPTGDFTMVSESKRPVEDLHDPNCRLIRVQSDYVSIHVNSGSYQFTATR